MLAYLRSLPQIWMSISEGLTSSPSRDFDGGAYGDVASSEDVGPEAAAVYQLRTTPDG
jgi:hypothetical protein